MILTLDDLELFGSAGELRVVEVTDDYVRGEGSVEATSQLKHDEPYLLTHCDGEFLVTLRPLPDLDATHVVFGRAPKEKIDRLLSKWRLKALVARSREDNAAAVREVRKPEKQEWQRPRGHMRETAETAARRQAKLEEKNKRKEAFGWDVFNADSMYKAYEKRLAKLPTGDNDHVDPLEYGTTPKDRGMDKMVAELHERYADNAKFSRRRAEVPGADVDYINERNKHFNKKIKRAFDKYTVELRQNLERGSAV